MEMKYVVPDMAQSFGTLEFAGESEPVFERDKNNRRVLARRSYNLYSDVQKGENVVVEIPVQAGEKKFQYEQKVKIVNPKLYGRGYAIGDMGHRLMKNLVWEYDALPHALIAGGTGGGKTYFLLTLIEALLHTDAVLYILDPKNADLADLGTVMGNVYHTKEEMIDCVNAFYEGMVQRSEEMKRHPNYKTGENYAYLGLPPCFLIFDEYVAFFEMLGTKESVSLLSQLKKIVMLGRQAGYFLIVACQRPDAKYFSDGIRDNFNFRVGLGRISELGYGMLFGSDVKKQFFQKRIKGRGYCDVGTSVISEFYTPLVQKGHDFLQTIGSLAQARQDGTATCEAKGDGTD